VSVEATGIGRARRRLLRAATTLVWIAPALEAQEKSSPDAGEPEVEVWEFNFSVFYSDPPGSDDRVTPILYADRGPLHLELRYGYEDVETVSLFAGWTFELGEELTAGLTPMLGGAVGETNGIVPAFEVDLGWRRISAYSEMEYLFDLEESDDSFFFSWSTLTYGITDWLAAGIVAERSKLVDTDFEVQRGLALELSYASLGLSLYAYNLGTDDSYAVVALGLSP
jgi:hypothetical protein